MLLTGRPARLVIPDLRFTSDYEELRKVNAIVVRLERSNNAPVNSHRSEVEHLDWDVDLVIDTTNNLDPDLYVDLEKIL